MKKACKEIKSLDINDVIYKSNLADKDPVVQAKNVVTAFNKHVVKSQETFTESLVAGTWVNPGTFLLGACNNIAELHLPNGEQRIRRGWYFSPTVNTESFKTYSQTERFFGAHGSFVLNVPVDSYALAWSGLTPMIFDSGPHVIHDATFSFDKLVKKTDSYIHHGTLHIIRVTAGEIAKAKINTTPFLLPYREEAYVFDDGLFTLIPATPNRWFHSALEVIISHDSIKRIMPKTGQVAITYLHGNLRIIEPNANGPTIIEDPGHSFNGFLDVNPQIHSFPSEEQKQERLQKNPRIEIDRLNNYVFFSGDSLEIAAVLVVGFRIKEPAKAVALLGEEKELLKKVEAMVAVDMQRTVSSMSAQEFLSSSSIQQGDQDTGSKPDNRIVANLTKELAGFGIELTRFNIESPIYLNKEIAQKMSQAAVKNAEIKAQQIILQRQAEVEEGEARRVAKTKKIQQDQANDATISAAEAALRAAEKQADAIKCIGAAKAEALKSLAAVLRDNPMLLQYEESRMIAEAIPNIHMTLPHPVQPFQAVKRAADPNDFFARTLDASSDYVAANMSLDKSAVL